MCASSELSTAHRGGYYAAYALFTALIFTLFSIASAPLPEDWRAPTKEEANQDWRKGAGHRYLAIKADFNGDSIIDEAKLLVQKTDRKIGLFAFVSQAKSFEKYRLDQEQDISFLNFMGIDLVKKGKYKTACGKGYSGCEPGDPNELNLKYTGIRYFNMENGEVYYYWNDTTMQFDHVQISD